MIHSTQALRHVRMYKRCTESGCGKWAFLQDRCKDHVGEMGMAKSIASNYTILNLLLMYTLLINLRFVRRFCYLVLMCCFGSKFWTASIRQPTTTPALVTVSSNKPDAKVIAAVLQKVVIGTADGGNGKLVIASSFKFFCLVFIGYHRSWSV